MARGCSKCAARFHEPEEHKGCQGHHEPGCPEMFWPDGHRRGTVHPEEMAIVRKRGLFTLQDELGAIFKSKSEEVPVE